MTISSGFFNSVSGDRKYNARHFNEIFDGMLKDGIYTTIGDQFNVTAGTGMQVIVGTGRGWFKNTWIYNDAPVPFSITSADPVYKRIDAIVIDVDTGTQVRNNDIKYILGTAASTPDKPTLIDTPTHKQYPLAWIMVNAGATAINSDNITDCKLTGEIPAVEAILEYSSHTKAEIDARFERDEKPSFNESQTEDNIASGETIFVIFGKIQKFINIIKNKLPVKYGGTGKNTFTANAVLLGNNANAVKEKNSNTGAFYSTGAGAEPQFGTLPVDKGGTGATTAAQALTNLGVPSDVAKAMSKDVYCSRDTNRSIIDVDHGGTGQTSLQATRNAMGLGNTTGALPVANGGTGITSNPSMVINLGTTAAASVFQASPRPGITGTLGVGNGGTGITSNPSMVTNLGTTAAASVFQASPRPGITGTLGVGNGGTGQTSLQATRNAMGLGNTTGALPVANGGTGQTSLQATRNAMGLGNTTGALPVANGGTGAADAATARSNLGCAATNHTHSYLPLTGGTINGSVQVTNTIWTKELQASGNVGASNVFSGNDITVGTIGTTYGDIIIYQGSSIYEMALNAGVKLTADRKIKFPNADGTVQVSGSSSRRVKKNINNMPESKARKLLNVNIVNFDYVGEFGGGLKDQCGVIAEDVLDIIPEAVEIADGYDESKPIDYKDNPAPAVDYRTFIPYLIKMVQIQQKEIDDLKEKSH